MSIHQEVIFKCSVNKLFDALTRADQFGELAGAPAEIAAEVGGEFSCFGGMVLGVTVDLVAGERVVQAWRVANWEPGEYSIVRFELEAAGDDGCKLVLDHLAYPEEHADHLEIGWHNMYWDPIKKYLDA